jgi:hypothetical protein
MSEYNVPGIEVDLKEHFSIVRESLDRIGIASKEKKILNPSCYLLHKRGKYYIIHFKNLLTMDGKETNYSEEDDIRQASIARLLEDWGLVEIVEDDDLPEDNVFVFVLPFREKDKWQIIHKYSIGSKKR